MPTDPAHYWEHQNLTLSFTDKTSFSIDTVGAKKYKQTANVPLGYVSELQRDLVTLGYLLPDVSWRDGLYEGSTQRAVLRFQRHAARPYRLPGPDAQKPDTRGPDALPSPEYSKYYRAPAARDATTVVLPVRIPVLAVESPELKNPSPELLTLLNGSSDIVFSGPANGVCDHATAQEIRKWISRGHKVPVGRFPLRALRVNGVAVGKLRQDAAEAWEEIVRRVELAGGTLAGPYGDTTRVLQKTTKSGTSRYSFHYCGRAVDINQGLAGGKGQRYYIRKEVSGQNTFWRLYCTTEKQDGSQGTKFTKGAFKWYSFWSSKEVDIPTGYYVDLTALIESTGTFERIKAQAGWENVYNKAEWWHFQYKADKQATFSDEMELIGYTEKQLRDAGWSTDSMLDHAPG